MNEEQYQWIQNKLNGMENRLYNLEQYLVPDKKDNSKLLQEIAKLVIKGKYPRKQPKKKMIEEAIELNKKATEVLKEAKAIGY